jgi:hypothetical protein
MPMNGCFATHRSLQKPLMEPVTPELSGAKLGHTDSVAAIVISDAGLVMTGSLDCSLCLFDINRPVESMRKMSKAHEKVRTEL